jgi:hypothetical protein
LIVSRVEVREPMTMSTAAGDLRRETASLRIDRNPQAHLRASHYGPGRWVGLVLLLAASIAGWWWLTAARLVTVRTTTVTLRTPGIQSGLSAGDWIVVEGPDSLTDGTRVQEE